MTRSWHWMMLWQSNVGGVALAIGSISIWRHKIAWVSDWRIVVWAGICSWRKWRKARVRQISFPVWAVSTGEFWINVQIGAGCCPCGCCGLWSLFVAAATVIFWCCCWWWCCCCCNGMVWYRPSEDMRVGADSCWNNLDLSFNKESIFSLLAFNGRKTLSPSSSRFRTFWAWDLIWIKVLRGRRKVRRTLHSKRFDKSMRFGIQMQEMWSKRTALSSAVKTYLVGRNCLIFFHRPLP